MADMVDLLAKTLGITVILVLLALNPHPIYENTNRFRFNRNLTNFSQESNTTSIGSPPQKSVIKRNFAVVSLSHKSIGPNRYFHLPIVALSWRRIGFESIFLIVDTNEFTSLDNKTFEYLNKLNYKIVYVKSSTDHEMLSRALSWTLIGILDDSLINDSDFVIITQSDLYPVRAGYYNRQKGDAIIVWNSNCCGQFKYKKKNYTILPIDHIGMKKRQWREVMQLDKRNYKIDSKSVFKLVSRFFSKYDHFNKTQSNQEINIAQKIISISIDKYVYDENKAVLVKLTRHVNQTRIKISASVWKKLLTNSSSLEGIVDMRSLHDHGLIDQWKLLQLFIAKAFGEEDKNILDQYFNEYAALNNVIELSVNKYPG